MGTCTYRHPRRTQPTEQRPEAPPLARHGRLAKLEERIMAGNRPAKPVADLPPDVLLTVLEHATTRTLGVAEQICTAWRATLRGAAGEALWARHCEAVWHERTQLREGAGIPAPSREALRLSSCDAALAIEGLDWIAVVPSHRSDKCWD